MKLITSEMKVQHLQLDQRRVKYRDEYPFNKLFMKRVKPVLKSNYYFQRCKNIPEDIVDAVIV